ncbi:unnamed protein product [Urochloa humidicola]
MQYEKGRGSHSTNYSLNPSSSSTHSCPSSSTGSFSSFFPTPVAKIPKPVALPPGGGAGGQAWPATRGPWRSRSRAGRRASSKGSGGSMAGLVCSSAPWPAASGGLASSARRGGARAGGGRNRAPPPRRHPMPLFPDAAAEAFSKGRGSPSAPRGRDGGRARASLGRRRRSPATSVAVGDPDSGGCG